MSCRATPTWLRKPCGTQAGGGFSTDQAMPPTTDRSPGGRSWNLSTRRVSHRAIGSPCPGRPGLAGPRLRPERPSRRRAPCPCSCVPARLDPRGRVHAPRRTTSIARAVLGCQPAGERRGRPAPGQVHDEPPVERPPRAPQGPVRPLRPQGRIPLASRAGSGDVPGRGHADRLVGVRREGKRRPREARPHAAGGIRRRWFRGGVRRSRRRSCRSTTATTSALPLVASTISLPRGCRRRAEAGHDDEVDPEGVAPSRTHSSACSTDVTPQIPDARGVPLVDARSGCGSTSGAL